MISVYKSNPLWMNFISLISLFQKEFHSIWNTALKTKCVHVGVFLYDSSDFIKFILSKRNFLDFNGLSSKLHLTYCTFSQMNFNSFVSLLQREFHSIWMGATKTNCVHDGTMKLCTYELFFGLSSWMATRAIFCKKTLGPKNPQKRPWLCLGLFWGFFLGLSLLFLVNGNL